MIVHELKIKQDIYRRMNIHFLSLLHRTYKEEGMQVFFKNNFASRKKIYRGYKKHSESLKNVGVKCRQKNRICSFIFPHCIKRAIFYETSFEETQNKEEL